jgi:hypothetical protein
MIEPIHAHLALAQQAVDTAARHRFEVPYEEVIDSLTSLVSADGAQRERAFRARGQLPLMRWNGHFWIIAGWCSKVLITLTPNGCHAKVSAPCQTHELCQALSLPKVLQLGTGFKWPPTRWGAAY